MTGSWPLAPCSLSPPVRSRYEPATKRLSSPHSRGFKVRRPESPGRVTPQSIPVADSVLEIVYCCLDMDRFVALPVGQGDSFFLQRGAFTALVDGGRSANLLPTLFTSHLEARGVNLLVCTHNDADHAKGVLGFLHSDLRCNEVWLPALWAERLKDLLEKPNKFINELADDIEKFDPPEGDVESDHPSLEEVGNSLVERYQGRERSHTNDAMPLESMEHHDDRELMWYWRLFNRFSPPLWFRSDNKRALCLGALSAAKRIRDIAVACTHRNVPIHWFQYCENLSRSRFEDPVDSLVPVNSVRVALTSYRCSALDYIALSIANRLSLVFCSPSAETWPGVLFTADSDLGFASKIPWREGMIVTAPHHGSEENKHAYSRAKCEMDDANDLFWVRSDSKSKLRPGASYCALPRRRRFCTRCRQTPYQSQVVRFGISGGCWAPSQSVRCCSCNCPK